MDDAHTSEIASIFYGYMLDESGRLDHTRAALALHRSMIDFARARYLSIDESCVYISVPKNLSFVVGNVAACVEAAETHVPCVFLRIVYFLCSLHWQQYCIRKGPRTLLTRESWFASFDREVFI